MQRVFELLFEVILMVVRVTAALITFASCLAVPVLGTLILSAIVACILEGKGWSKKASDGAASAFAITHCLAWLYVVQTL